MKKCLAYLLLLPLFSIGMSFTSVAYANLTQICSWSLKCPSNSKANITVNSSGSNIIASIHNKQVNRSTLKSYNTTGKLKAQTTKTCDNNDLQQTGQLFWVAGSWFSDNLIYVANNRYKDFPTVETYTVKDGSEITPHRHYTLTLENNLIGLVKNYCNTGAGHYFTLSGNADFQSHSWIEYTLAPPIKSTYYKEFTPKAVTIWKDGIILAISTNGKLLIDQASIKEDTIDKGDKTELKKISSINLGLSNCTGITATPDGYVFIVTGGKLRIFSIGNAGKTFTNVAVYGYPDKDIKIMDTPGAVSVVRNKDDYSVYIAVDKDHYPYIYKYKLDFKGTRKRI